MCDCNTNEQCTCSLEDLRRGVQANTADIVTLGEQLRTAEKSLHSLVLGCMDMLKSITLLSERIDLRPLEGEEDTP
jgi:hypothetical protein